MAKTTGLIPTYAGNTRGGAYLRRKGWAHPHVCGEHFTAFQPSRRHAGSSPRMRGTHTTPRGVKFKPGLIPTYAGNT